MLQESQVQAAVVDHPDHAAGDLLLPDRTALHFDATCSHPTAVAAAAAAVAPAVLAAAGSAGESLEVCPAGRFDDAVAPAVADA